MTGVGGQGGARVESPASRYDVVAFGVDDMTLGFDMTGSRSIGRLNEMDGVMSRRGKMLGQRASWGKWVHALGRSASFWKADRNRLYVQAKLADEGALCSPGEVGSAVDRLLERMAVVGIISYEPAWVTRLDVAVDARCRPADGKLLLDALAAARLPNGWRTRSVGVPRSTVYFTARASDKVKARSYCRNLKTKQGEPFGLIRLEAQEGFDPLACPLEIVTPLLLASVWHSRFGKLSGEVRRLGREQQAVRIAGRVERGEITYAQGERLSMFLDLESLGLATSYYPQSVYASRRREATRHGYAPNELGAAPLEVDLDALLAPYAEAVAQAA